MDNDGIDDDVCDGYPEHRGVRETYHGDNGIQWECTRCGAEGWEDAVTNDGTDACCTGTCTDACGGYGRMLEADARRRVAFIGQPSAGKTTTASCCGEREDIPLEEEPLSLELPGFVGMIRGGRNDLARRAKDIVRGTTAHDEFTPFGRDEALRRITEEDADLLRRLAPNDGPICKCPSGACVCRGAQ